MKLPLIEWITVKGSGPTVAKWLKWARKRAQFLYTFKPRTQQRVRMGDGTEVWIRIEGSQAYIMVAGGLSTFHHFLFYEKSFNGGQWPFGYWTLYKENEQPKTLVKSLPYIIGEPEELPMDWPVQVNSITQQKFKYTKDESDNEYSIPDEVIVETGKNTRYGNQYRTIGENVYSWWHSGSGDLPVIEYELLADFIVKNLKYYPAYIVEFNIGYAYMTEQAGFIQKVPVNLYKNGKDFLSLGEPGGALICDVIQHKNKDLLILLSSYNSIWMIRYRKDGDVPQKTLGTIILGEVLAGWPWRFSQDATKCGGLIYLRDVNDLLTTHLVEFSIEENDGEYSWEEISRQSYVSTYDDVKTTSPINENVVTPNPGGYLFWNVSHTKTGTRTEQNTDITFSAPIGANYSEDNELIVATLQRTIHYYYKADTSTGSDLNEWAKYYSPGAPIVGYWTISRKENYSYSNNSEVLLERSYQSTIQLPHKSVLVEQLDFDRSYQQFLYYNYYEDGGLYDVTYGVTGGGSTYLSYAHKTGYYDGNNRFGKTSSESVIGFEFQLRYLDVARSVLVWNKINYDIRREGDDYKEWGTRDHSDTIYVDYLQPTQSITTTQVRTQFATSVRPDLPYTFNSLTEHDSVDHTIDSFNAVNTFASTDLLDLTETHPNNIYAWSKDLDTLAETGNYAAASVDPQVGPSSPINSLGYSYPGGNGSITITYAIPSVSDFMFSPFLASPSTVVEPGLAIYGNDGYFSNLFKKKTKALNMAVNDAGYFVSLQWTYNAGAVEAADIHRSVFYSYLPEVNTLDIDPLSLYPIGFF